MSVHTLLLLNFLNSGCLSHFLDALLFIALPVRILCLGSFCPRILPTVLITFALHSSKWENIKPIIFPSFLYFPTAFKILNIVQIIVGLFSHGHSLAWQRLLQWPLLGKSSSGSVPAHHNQLVCFFLFFRTKLRPGTRLVPL